MSHLADAAPGSSLVFTFIRKDFLDGQEMYGAGPDEDVPRYLEPAGRDEFVSEIERSVFVER